jgi:hypothetical protein
MFNVGPAELLFIGLFPFCGILAAIYLSLALRSNSRGQERS